MKKPRTGARTTRPTTSSPRRITCKEPVGADDERTQVINLCRSYKYLGTGYYVSLLAEARGHKVIPSVRTINDLRRRSLYGLDIDDLNQKLQQFLPAGGRDTTDFGILVYFGETSYPTPARTSRGRCSKRFPCPILRIEFERERVWQISAIKPTGLHTLSDPQEDAFAQALDKFSKKLWRKPRARQASSASTSRCWPTRTIRCRRRTSAR